MKNVMKILLVSAALVVASPASATPGLAGSTTPIEQGTIGLTSPSTPAQIAAALKGQPKYPAKDFSLAEIEAVLRSANGWNSNEVIPLNYRFSIPLPVEVPAPKPEQVITPTVETPVKEASAPATASTGSVQPPASPELKRLRALQQANARELKALRSAVSARGANAPQAPGEAAKIAELTKRDGDFETRIKTLEESLKAKADKSYVDGQLKLKADAAGVYTKEEVDAMFSNLPAGESLPWWAWGLIILAACLGIFNLFRSRGMTEEEVNTKLLKTKLQSEVPATTLADIEELKTDVRGLKSRFKHEVRKIHNGEHATLMPAVLKQLEDGKEFDYHVLVDGEIVTFGARALQQTQSGDMLIKIDQLKKPVTAKSLFASVADHIESGGELPTLTLVQTA